MGSYILLLLSLFLTLVGSVCAAIVGNSRDDPFAAVDRAAAAAIERGDCPGAVVVVVHEDAVVFRKANGRRSLKPEGEAMTLDTIFDLASLTKPIATGTAVMQLIEQGKLYPNDLVGKHWPAFAANGKETVTIAQLLLHTSGLTADNAMADYADGKAQALARIAALKPDAPPGSRFKYSDVGYIVLGEVVEKVSGLSLDAYAKRHVFEPLRMIDSTFRPDAAMKARIAPTGMREGKVIRGEVHDPRSFALGGVAGHAGLFATADDLARYCRMLLRGGELDGARVLADKTVKLFTEPHTVPGALGKDRTAGMPTRTYGWDANTSYSGQRGDLFPRGEGFGHTGFTGTSIWVDSKSKTAVIVLTNRVHPDDKGSVTRMRREIATAVARALE